MNEELNQHLEENDRDLDDNNLQRRYFTDDQMAFYTDDEEELEGQNQERNQQQNPDYENFDDRKMNGNAWQRGANQILMQLVYLMFFVCQ